MYEKFDRRTLLVVEGRSPSDQTDIETVYQRYFIMRSTFDIVLMTNSYSFPSKLVSWINKAKENAIVVTTDLEIQQYCPHATIIDRDPDASTTSIGTTEGRTRLQPSVADPASSPKCDVCNDNSSNDDEASSTSDDYKIDDIIYDQISTLKTIKLVVLYDCFWDGQNKLLDRVYEHFQNSSHYKLVLVTQYADSIYLHRNRKFHVADRIYIPHSMIEFLKIRGAPWLHKRYRKTPWLSWYRRALKHNFSQRSLRLLHLRNYSDSTKN